MQDEHRSDALEDASVVARTKMEQHANYLLRQVEAIETAGKECRVQVKKLEKANKSKVCLTEVIPPSLLAVSFDETATDRMGSSDDENWLFASAHSMEEAPVGAPRHHPPSLADDLSSYEGSPGDSRRVQELEAENQRLRETVKQCYKAALFIQSNADLKIVRLEFEVAHLRQQLADELATNSKVMVMNQSLRKQLNHAASDIIQKKHGSLEEKKRFCAFMQLHQRELTVERHLNGLITSRNLAIKESTALKKLLLGTCFECRQRLPLKRRIPDENSAQAEPVPTARPTYQSSARLLLENMPKQPTAPLRPQSAPPTSSPKSPVKSCLKKTPASSSLISPTSATALLSEEVLALPSLPESPPTPTRKVIDTQEGNMTISNDKNNMYAATSNGQSDQTAQRLSPVRRFGLDAKEQPRRDRQDRVEENSSSAEPKRQAGSTTPPPSPTSGSDSSSSPSGAAREKQKSSTKSAKEKPRWKRSGGFFGAKNKRVLERIDC